MRELVVVVATKAPDSAYSCDYWVPVDQIDRAEVHANIRGCVGKAFLFGDPEMSVRQP